ncbi:MAG: acyl-CoA thioesterase [Gammaproteobacteria bacterium]|nr:acyl-CoA thioesterase [Gammaproteobacteria bacterium]
MAKDVELPAGQPAIRVLAMPMDTNPAGDIFGGWLMAQADIAAGLIAGRRAAGRVVTVAVNAFEFHEPVYVGDLVSCYGEVVRTGRSSMTIKIEAYAQRNSPYSRTVKVTEADMTFVAVDDRGEPRALPIETPEPR